MRPPGQRIVFPVARKITQYFMDGCQRLPSTLRTRAPCSESVCSASDWIPTGRRFPDCSTAGRLPGGDRRPAWEPRTSTLVDAGIVDNPLQAGETAEPVPPRRGRVDLRQRGDLRPVFHRVAGSAERRACRSSCSVCSRCPKLDYAAFNALGDRGTDDGRLAGTLPGLLRPGNCLRLRPRRHRLSPRHRLPPRRRGVAGNRRAGSRPPRSAPSCGKTAWACWDITMAACWTSTAT